MTTPHFQILTIFPEIFSGFLDASLIKKAIEAGLVRISLINIRDFADPPHYKVDDTPYGGGAGMVMRAEPLARAIEKAKEAAPQAKVILLSPSGNCFNQAKAQQFSECGDLIMICGRYEGIDQRIIDLFVNEELSVGDYVLMGGELPAMIVMEASIRLMNEVLGNKDSVDEESFCIEHNGSLLLEAPHYTKPAEFRGLTVPTDLTSGNHKRIAEWRRQQALAKTVRVRPDLLKSNKSSKE